jgi:DNA helicase-2/ATP-dependent DNA helicase PcrA
VKDAAAYLRLALTPSSDIDLLRVVNRPARGIGEKTVERLQAHAAERGASLFEALSGVEELAELGPRARKALASFRDLVAELHGAVASLDAGVAVQVALEKSEMIARLQAEGADESMERAENLMELVAAAREFDEATAGEPPPRDADEPSPPPLARFLEGIALLGDADAETPEGRVALMTLHAAKGLEFESVIMAGVEEGLLPYQRPWRRKAPSDDGAQAEDLDEERRLCYVGMTRAKSLLTLSLARRRMSFGEMGPAFRETEPSRFLQDLPPELFGEAVARRVRDRERPRLRVAAMPPRVRHQAGAFQGEPHVELDAPGEYDFDQRPESARGFAAGQHVRHATLGEGIVQACEGPGPEAKVTVAFFAAGQKRVIAKWLRPA